jgi:hypothetical protein
MANFLSASGISEYGRYKIVNFRTVAAFGFRIETVYLKIVFLADSETAREFFG